MRRRQHETNNFETDHDHEIEFTKFADIPCKSLEETTRNQCTPWNSHISTRETYEEEKLERIASPDRHVTRPKTAIKRDSGRIVGVAVSYQCCACKKYLKRDDTTNYSRSFFCFSICKIPLCRENNVDPEVGRKKYLL